MNTIRRIAKNSVASLLTQISTPIVSFVLIFLIARRLGTSGLGEYSTALAMYYIFQAVSSFGFNLLITREVAKDSSKANKYFVNGSFLALFFSTFAAVIMCIAVNWITTVPTIKHSVYILSASLLFYALATVFQSISMAFEKFEYVTIPYIAENMLKLSFGFFVLFQGYGLTALMLVMVASQLINLLLSLYFSLRFVTKPLTPKYNFTFCRKILKDIPIFSFIIILSTIRLNVDVLFITKMLGVDEVGYYSAANKLVHIFKLGISSYIMAIQPIIFRIFASSIEKFKYVCTESIRFLVIIILPVIAGFIILSDRVIVLIFTDTFLPSAHVLSILIWMLLFYSFNQVLANTLIGSNYQRLNLIANIIGFVASLFLNLILITYFGFIGAAIATTGSAVIVAVIQYYFVSRNIFKISLLQLFKKPFTSVILMTGMLLLWKNSNLLLMIVICVITYFFFLISLQTFSQKDLEIIRGFYRRKSTS